jgi:hypothetical protein
MFPHTEENLSLEHLTPEQREDFKRSLVDGRISDMITPWQPWWLQPASGTHLPGLLPIFIFFLFGLRPAAYRGMSPKGLIVPVETKREDESESESEVEDEDEVEVEERKPPSVLPDIPPLSTLLSKEPSPLLAFNLLDILYGRTTTAHTRTPNGGGNSHSALPLLCRFSYAYVMRYFNGEPDSEASDAASFLVEISAVLQVLSRCTTHTHTHTHDTHTHDTHTTHTYTTY